MSDPEPLLELTLDGSKVSLLGTAHVSKKSAETVSELLASGEYDHVAIELCDNRYRAIINPDALAEMDLFQVIRSGQAPMIMASLALGAFQQRIAEQFGIQPGAEMRAAINSADTQNIPVHLIDRDVGTTLKRVYRSVPWWKRMMIFSGLLASVLSRQEIEEEEIEKLKQGDLLESTFGEFREEAPEIYHPLIDERDEFMACRIQQIVATDSPQNLLAIVGAGHLQGIADYLGKGDSHGSENEIASRLEELKAIPSRRNVLKWIPWLIVALVLTGFYLGFRQSPELGFSLVASWILINGSLSALGAALAGGHPLTVLTAFIAAPITSLNPMIGAGIVTGAVELALRKPRVGDFERLRQDVANARGWWRNRVSRTLMVFFFSTMGSAIGTWVAGARIFARLSG